MDKSAEKRPTGQLMERRSSHALEMRTLEGQDKHCEDHENLDQVWDHDGDRRIIE